MGHVAQMEERRNVERVLMGKPEGKNHLEAPYINGRLILRWMFRKWDNPCWLSIVTFPCINFEMFNLHVQCLEFNM